MLRLIFLSSVHTWMAQTSRRQKTDSCSCAGPDQVLSLYRVAKGTKGRKGLSLLAVALDTWQVSRP